MTILGYFFPSKFHKYCLNNLKFSEKVVPIQLHKLCKKKKKKKKKLYGPFLWIGFNCLKARSTFRRQFTFYHLVPRNSWYLFYRPRKDESWVDLGATHWFWIRDPWIGNPMLKPQGHCTIILLATIFCNSWYFH